MRVWFASMMATAAAIFVVANSQQISNESDHVVGSFNSSTTSSGGLLKMYGGGRSAAMSGGHHKSQKKTQVIQKHLNNAPYSGLLLVKIGIGRPPIAASSLMVVNTLSSNFLAFDGEQVKKNKLKWVCYTGSFFPGPEKSRDASKDVVFKYADKTRYSGQMVSSNNVRLTYKGVLKEMTFGFVHTFNDAALILRAIDHAGIVGLNPFTKAVNGGTNFLNEMVDSKLIGTPSFAFSVAEDGQSQHITFGGAEKRDRKAGLMYFPVVGLLPHNKPSSWAMHFEKLLFNDKLIIENFVAEFDSSLPYGLADPTRGGLVQKYTKLVGKLPHLEDGDISLDTNGEMLVDCNLRKWLPDIQLVAKDGKGRLHTFTLDGEDLFSNEYKRPQQSKNNDKDARLCGSSFFEDPPLDEEEEEEDTNAPVKKGGAVDKAHGSSTTLRFGLRVMKRFHTMDFRAENKGGNSGLSGEIGLLYKAKKSNLADFFGGMAAGVFGKDCTTCF